MNDIIASKCFMLLEYTQKIELRKIFVRRTGSVKSVKLPSPEEATPLGETPCCGKPAKVDGTISLGKLCERLRLMAGQRNNPSICGTPQAYQLCPLFGRICWGLRD